MIDLREEKTRYILSHYGDTAQILKALEELAELQAELWKVYKYIQNGEKDFIKGASLLLDVQSEIADVLVMTGQIKQMLGITDSEINRVINFKVSRTLQRTRNND